MIECYKCNGKMADNAAACPHCGAPKWSAPLKWWSLLYFPFGSFWSFLFLFFVVQALFALGMISCQTYYFVMEHAWVLFPPLAFLITGWITYRSVKYGIEPLGEIIGSILPIGSILLFAASNHWADQKVKRIEIVVSEYKQVRVDLSKEVGVLDVAWDQSGMIARLVARMKAIDCSGCPGDFRQAFLLHIRAWERYQDVARRYGGFSGFMKGFLSGGGALLDAVTEGIEAEREITSTYKYMNDIAIQHGLKPEKVP